MKEFVEGFANFTEDIPIQRIRPATSTVIYKTRCSDWTPEQFGVGIPGIDGFERIRTLISIRCVERSLSSQLERNWSYGRTMTKFYDWVWDLLVAFWEEKQHLLFINSSSNEGLFRSLAQAVAGADVQIINENAVF